MIVHEDKVSIWGDEGEDTLRLPALKPHTRMETHIIQNTRILFLNKVGFHVGRTQKGHFNNWNYFL